MRRSAEPLLWLALALLALRLVSMAAVPLTDTSEPRYAEIARLMAQTGDWITPWFEPGTPFWGKPPLSFWAQALSIRLFGLAEWAARLPSWLAMLATLAALHALAREHAGRRAAAWSVLIYTTSALPYLAAGAVLTDPYLALGTTLAMAGLMLPGWRWRLLGALGLVIGLLSKGPLVLVLALAPAVICRLLYRRAVWPVISTRQAVVGLLVVLGLALPWYLLAEWKTPGFLDYFIVGEHLRRFLDPGWAGDLYGTAHQRPYGSIWWHAVLATFPWGILALAALGRALATPVRRHQLARQLANPRTGYLVAWFLCPLLFFTFSGNVLWTYTLPALPAFAILLGGMLAARSHDRDKSRNPPAVRASGGVWWRQPAGLGLVVPVAALLTAGVAISLPQAIKTERELVRYVDSLAAPGLPLCYLDSQPFSARYYSRGRAARLDTAELLARADLGGETVYIAVARQAIDALPPELALERLPAGDSKRYLLTRAHLRPGPARADGHSGTDCEGS